MIIAVTNKKQCSRQLQVGVQSSVCFISCQALGALPFIDTTHGRIKSTGGRGGKVFGGAKSAGGGTKWGLLAQAACTTLPLGACPKGTSHKNEVSTLHASAHWGRRTLRRCVCVCVCVCVFVCVFVCVCAYVSVRVPSPKLRQRRTVTETEEGEQ